MRKIFFLPLVIVSLAFSKEPSCKETVIKDAAAFPVGIAVNTDKLKYEEKYWLTALRHFNSFTPEKILKPQYIHPRKDKFDFWEPDHLIDFCKEQKIRLHGHALIWHESNPEWLHRYEGTTAEWDSLLKRHVQTIVRHCSHYIRSWDVVNEAFLDDGSLRDNIWKHKIGDSYFEKAYLYAREADPEALLFYNDYSLEQNGTKLERVLSYINSLREKGVKIDGIGMQMHVHLYKPSIKEINSAAKKIAESGLLVHYSEVDVSRAGESTFLVSAKKLREQQRLRYKEIVQGYMSLPEEKRFGITLWGVSDNDTWLGEDHVRAKPLLFDTRYRPKPAFCGFLEGLKNE